MPRQLSAALFFAVGGLILGYVFATLLADIMLTQPVTYWFLGCIIGYLPAQHPVRLTQFGLISR